MRYAPAFQLGQCLYDCPLCGHAVVSTAAASCRLARLLKETVALQNTQVGQPSPVPGTPFQFIDHPRAGKLPAVALDPIRDGNSRLQDWDPIWSFSGERRNGPSDIIWHAQSIAS